MYKYNGPNIFEGFSILNDIAAATVYEGRKRVESLLADWITQKLCPNNI